MQKLNVTDEVRPTSQNHAPTHTAPLATRAIEVVQASAVKVASGAEKVVRHYPLASVGVALGSGIAVGALSYRMLATRRPPTMLERLGLATLGKTFMRGFSPFF